jgi:hypothetical protein
MPTWENELYSNGLWLDTSNPAMNVLKKYDPTLDDWVPTIGTYSADAIDNKIAALQQKGATADRPLTPTVGLVFFDTTLGKPIWCKEVGSPNIWIDGTGTVV